MAKAPTATGKAGAPPEEIAFATAPLALRFGELAVEGAQATVRPLSLPSS